jgi:hypothetical protein
MKHSEEEYVNHIQLVRCKCNVAVLTMTITFALDTRQLSYKFFINFEDYTAYM